MGQQRLPLTERLHPGMLSEIISEQRATSNRNGGRDHPGIPGHFPRNPQVKLLQSQPASSGWLVRGRIRTGRLWVYVRDDRPFCGPAPPAAVYFSDRGGEHPATHLAHFTDFLQADAYSGFAEFSEPRPAGPGLPALPAITEAACWAHSRRDIFDVWQTTEATVCQSGAQSDRRVLCHRRPGRLRPARRAAGAARPSHHFARRLLRLAQAAERRLSSRSDLAEALRYIIKRRAALTRFASDAGLEPDSNIAENAIRIALGRRNWAFAVSHSGCKRAAAIVLDPGDRKK